jgi:hypothetical protein
MSSVIFSTAVFLPIGVGSFRQRQKPPSYENRGWLGTIGYSRIPSSKHLAPNRLEIGAPDKRAKDCACLRYPLLSRSLAGELSALGLTEISLMFRRLLLVCGFAMAVASRHSASAQVPYQWSSDVAVGGAIVNGGDFVNNGRAAAHLSVADRMLRRERFAMYVEVGYDWLGRFGLLGADPDGTCVVTTPGVCAPPYPDVAGPSASVGLLFAPIPRVETRVGVGGAAYSVDGTRIGAAVGQLDAAVVSAAHLALVLDARFAVIPRYRHDRLTLLPLLIGIRLH